MKLSEELRKRLELAEAFERGEKVEVLDQGVWWPADRYNITANCLSTIRIAPRTIRIGDRDVPMPSWVVRVVNYSLNSGMVFKTPEDRRSFDDAVIALMGGDKSDE